MELRPEATASGRLNDESKRCNEWNMHPMKDM